MRSSPSSAARRRAERKVLECVPDFAVGPGGVYRFACEAGPSGTLLYLLDPTTGRDRLLGTLEKAEGRFTVSPTARRSSTRKRLARAPT